ncbi:uncharacterized protein LOC133930119 [Phragmites australis]|uniref:uncharacterized protein LOC133930119 n=1 Tax=Phragmites australis TaxID=29695 RepID=UPI002D77A358|nr:uncharacterized protein LOC133930119 [Phragmites australis]
MIGSSNAEKTDMAMELQAALTKAKLDARSALRVQAVDISSIKLLVPITLDLQVGNYAQWHGLFEVTLEKFSLDDHVHAPSSSSLDAQWLRLNAFVCSWLYVVVSIDLLAMVMDSAATSRDIWSRIEGLYRDNTDTRVIYLKQEFHKLMQGLMFVADYCRKQKTLADELTVMGTPIVDKSLILNTLHGLNQRFAHMRMLLSMQLLLPTFLVVHLALLLEELMMSTKDSAPSAPKPPPITLPKTPTTVPPMATPTAMAPPTIGNTTVAPLPTTIIATPDGGSRNTTLPGGQGHAS